MNGGTIRNSDVAVFVSADSTAGVRCGDGSLFSVGIRYVDRAVLRQVYAAVGGDSSVIAVVADGDLRAISGLDGGTIRNGDSAVVIRRDAVATWRRDGCSIVVVFVLDGDIAALIRSYGACFGIDGAATGQSDLRAISGLNGATLRYGDITVFVSADSTAGARYGDGGSLIIFRNGGRAAAG